MEKTNIFAKLEINIMDVMKENQIKIGYRSEMVRLYYPLQSLNRFLKSDESADEMQKILSDYFDLGKSRLGNVEISHKGDRFCLQIPTETADYVHENMHENEFIQKFIHMIQRHGITIEELLAVFREYSEHVHFEKINGGEFDYLIYFENEIPDDYRYCITDEGCHMTYHRFTPDDYMDIV